MAEVEPEAAGCVSDSKQAKFGQKQPSATVCFMEGSLTT